MIWILHNEDATFAGRQIACRMLRRVGTSRAVPPLEALLRDPRLSHPARFALQGMMDPGAGKALRDALMDAGDRAIEAGEEPPPPHY